MSVGQNYFRANTDVLKLHWILREKFLLFRLSVEVPLNFFLASGFISAINAVVLFLKKKLYFICETLFRGYFNFSWHLIFFFFPSG